MPNLKSHYTIDSIVLPGVQFSLFLATVSRREELSRLLAENELKQRDVLNEYETAKSSITDSLAFQSKLIELKQELDAIHRAVNLFTCRSSSCRLTPYYRRGWRSSRAVVFFLRFLRSRNFFSCFKASIHALQKP